MPLYRFAEFVLDTRSGELRRGAYRVRLRPQPAVVLEHFLRHPGEVVTRDELRRILWSETTFVRFDQGLNSCIKQLRAALQDRPGAPRFLETLPRRGYRFIRRVVAEPPAAGAIPNDAILSISGSARVDAGRVYVRIQLSDTSSGETVWTTELDGDTEDVPGLQARIGSRVMEGVAGTLRRGRRGNGPTPGPKEALTWGRAAHDHA